MSRSICWFSCGAASAVASHFWLKDHPDALVAYCDTGAEHADNERFLVDCERWLGKTILRLRSIKYRSVWEVFEKTRYLAGVNGARCTTEMKKKVRQAFPEPYDEHPFGFTAEEQHRAKWFIENNPEQQAAFPLISQNVRKGDCFDMLMVNNIALPAMYLMGYRNNNCIGCVKGQAGYWNKIRRDFPEVFKRMALLEREIGAAICKTEAGGKRTKVFLDELPPDAGRYEDLDISCGLFCGQETA